MTSRQRKAQVEWARTLQDWQASGQTIREYCRQHGIREPRFYMWKKRLGLTTQSKEKLKASENGKVEPTMRFLPVQIKESTIVQTASKKAPSDGERVDIFLPNGSVLRFAGAITEDKLSLIVNMVTSC